VEVEFRMVPLTVPRVNGPGCAVPEDSGQFSLVYPALTCRASLVRRYAAGLDGLR